MCPEPKFLAACEVLICFPTDVDLVPENKEALYCSKKTRLSKRPSNKGYALW
jgi:hypothetical protein